ncbi:MAG: hypothetical protein U0263_27090 [Polyangiaceae bacterium]
MASFGRGQSGLLWAALIAGAAVVASCSTDDGEQPKPCTVSAAFDLTVRAVAGPLPTDTTIEVKYGGGIETYRVDQGMTGQEVVLCDDELPEAGDAGKQVELVHCKLWTQGAASVTVTATGFPTVEEDLEAKASGKCIKTVPVEIVLGDVDGGS